MIPVTKRPSEGLKIRESKTLGFFSEGLTKHAVENYKQIEAWMEEGTKNRTVASTKMNNSSSRAHTIICIEFR